MPHCGTLRTSAAAQVPVVRIVSDASSYTTTTTATCTCCNRDQQPESLPKAPRAPLTRRATRKRATQPAEQVGHQVAPFAPARTRTAPEFASPHAIRASAGIWEAGRTSATLSQPLEKWPLAACAPRSASLVAAAVALAVPPARLYSASLREATRGGVGWVHTLSDASVCNVHCIACWCLHSEAGEDAVAIVALAQPGTSLPPDASAPRRVLYPFAHPPSPNPLFVMNRGFPHGKEAQRAIKWHPLRPLARARRPNSLPRMPSGHLQAFGKPAARAPRSASHWKKWPLAACAPRPASLVAPAVAYRKAMQRQPPGGNSGGVLVGYIYTS